MIVLDTSALVDFLVGADVRAERVRTRCVGEQLIAPSGTDLECASALRGLVRGGKLPAEEGRQALRLLARTRIRRCHHTPLLPRIWQLRENMWPYDAAYVALAELVDVELVVVDTKFARTPGLRCAVHTIAAE